jgi:hypothetical protein
MNPIEAYQNTTKHPFKAHCAQLFGKKIVKMDMNKKRYVMHKFLGKWYLTDMF